MLPFTGKFWSSLTVIAIAAWQSASAISARRRLAEAAKRGAEPLRVLFVHRDLPIHGGVPRSLLYLARALDRARMEMRVASFDPPAEAMTRAFGEIEIKPATIHDGGYWGPCRRLGAIIRDANPDIIVATTFKAYLCAKIATRGRVTVVFWLHSIVSVMKGSVRKGMYRWLSRNDPLLFISQAVRAAHLPANHAGPEAVIYNGVGDVPEQMAYGREMRQALSIPDDAVVLAYVAEFVECKDHPTAIAAMEALVRREINAHLLLIGVGQNFDEMRRMAAASAAADRIHFLETRNDVRQLMGIVDLYLHTGRDEGFGLAIVEAMLAAKPVIAAKSGGIPEFVESGKTGLLFEPGDAADLTRQIISLVQDHQKARELGAAARAMCLERLSPERFALEMTDFLRRVWAGRAMIAEDDAELLSITS